MSGILWALGWVFFLLGSPLAYFWWRDGVLGPGAAPALFQVWASAAVCFVGGFMFWLSERKYGR